MIDAYFGFILELSANRILLDDIDENKYKLEQRHWATKTFT